MDDSKAIERCVNLVIRALQSIGFFSEKPRVTVWRIRFDTLSLSREGYRAAATVERECPLMVLPQDFRLENDIEALIHESIHLAQILKGDLVPGCGDGTMIWKGQKYNKLPATHERYFDDQPWEEESRRLCPIVRKKLSAQS